MRFDLGRHRGRGARWFQSGRNIDTRQTETSGVKIGGAWVEVVEYLTVRCIWTLILFFFVIAISDYDMTLKSGQVDRDFCQW